MPILNYSTSIKASQTIGEITSMLVRKGARTISSEFRKDGSIEGVSFVMAVGGMPLRFLLPSNASGVAASMLRDKPWSNRMRVSVADYQKKLLAQAEDVSWRILKDWVEAQLALVESGQGEMGQVFMPYAISSQDGRTMYQLFVENTQKQLGAGQ